MSFFANNERPDLLKKNEDNTARDSRFGEVPSALPDVQPSPFTTTESRSKTGTSSSIERHQASSQASIIEPDWQQ